MPARSGKERPIIGITLGDPAGIGPEVALKAARSSSWLGAVRLLLIGPRSIVEHYAKILRFEKRLHFVNEVSEVSSGRELHVLDTGGFDLRASPLGQVHPDSGGAALEAIRRGVALAREGRLDALVTGPIHKKAAQLAGMVGAGHTEFIAHLCGVREVRLMLVAPRLRVIHVTAHVGLREALELITRDRIVRTIELGSEMLGRLGVGKPRIAVAGLNPHASDEGLFGHEEELEIIPAVATAARSGFQVQGPFSPDTVFRQAWQGEFDLVVAMLHDHGHVAVKMLGFAEAVNVTAGLPIVRTSVDHGTAFDIAGRNRANPQNMKRAIELAARLARRRLSP